MIRINEMRLQKMLQQKSNEVIYLLQHHSASGMQDNICLAKIKEVYQDNHFIELFNQKNDEDNKDKN
ncbi:MAG: hypothetical protein ACRC0A_07035 [Chitinophagaceae bacterium]